MEKTHANDLSELRNELSAGLEVNGSFLVHMVMGIPLIFLSPLCSCFFYKFFFLMAAEKSIY